MLYYVLLPLQLVVELQPGLFAKRDTGQRGERLHCELHLIELHSGDVLLLIGVVNW